MSASTFTPARRSSRTIAPSPADSPFGRDVLAGLRESPRRIAPKYFYDVAGSALFDRICELPEYYPTRTEAKILRAHREAIAAAVGPHAEVIEFGAGSLAKIRLLLDAFAADEAPSRYVPIDICGKHLKRAARSLTSAYPGLDVQPIVADYTMPFILPKGESHGGMRVGFFPGSSFGNFEPDEALDFLRRAARLLQGGALILGVDLVKKPSVLHAAYNDAQGVTAAFNLNLLRRINLELEADFDLDGFAHHACYAPAHQRIEMHLISRRRQTVRLGRECFDFVEGESILTEKSHKFTVDGLRDLAEAAGFSAGQAWIDEASLFCVQWLAAPGRQAKA